MADNLLGLLTDVGIRPSRFTAGQTTKLICPRCEGGRTKELSLSLTIDQDGAGATWNCHRATCGWKSGGRVHADNGGAPAPRTAKVIQPPPVHADQAKPDMLYEFFDARGISPDTVDLFGCYVIRHWFNEEIGTQDAIVFPYVHGGKVVNRKYREIGKRAQIQEKNPLPSLFNVDAIAEPDVVWWVEGEPDVMAMHEAGYRQTVTLKDGAPDKLRDENDPRRGDDKRFAALALHGELLIKVGKFVLAGDMDEPGTILREELARRLGRHRCWIVTWPEGCKDAGDVLLKHGVRGVQAAVEAAKPYPIEGLQHVEEGTLEQLFGRAPPAVLTTGIAATDAIMKLPGEGRLCVITGIPNHGKSSFVTFLMVHTADRHDRRWAIFSPEMQPWEEYAALCAQILIGKPFRGNASFPSMTKADRAWCEQWMANRLVFLASDAEESAPTLEWIMDRTRIAIMREGVTDLLIDPWNEVEHLRGDLSETEYVGRSLQRLKAFGYRHGCNVWIVAHPTKMVAAKPGAVPAAPGLYDINGSANWANKADFALTVHTPGPVTEIYVRKTRFSRWGKRNTMAELEFDPMTGRYRSAVLSHAYDDEPIEDRSNA